jgi:signal transduction histidine kinase
VTKTGRTRICLTSIRLAPHLGYLEGSTLDITERKQAEQALQEYAERLAEMVEERTRELRAAQDRLVRQEKLAVLGQLAGGVGHELRNPLGAIKNAACFLHLALASPEPDVIETLQILEREVANCDRIISDLLDFARPKPPALQKVDLRQLTQATLAHQAVPEAVQVETRFDDAQPPVLADPGQLELVLGNLIRNAVQAMPQGGRLVVGSAGTRCDSAGRAEWAAVCIADTGEGIPPENLNRVFEPLFTTKAKGIGLGLALSKMLVEGQGGTITVESVVGQGATFTVWLPVNRPGGYLP